MEFQFYIYGMTCSGCQKTVTEKIASLQGVDSVEVILATGEAKIHAKRELSADEISNKLGSKYTVVNNLSLKNEEISTSKLKQLTPLFLIFIYLTAATLFLTDQLQGGIEKGMYIFMGLFFIVFGFFKFLDYGGFPESFKRYDPLAKRIPGYAKIYPFIETGLGVAFLTEWQLPFILFVTLFILCSTSFGVLHSLLQKSQIECACLGTALKLPMTEATLIENAIMLIMSSILLTNYFV